MTAVVLTTIYNKKDLLRITQQTCETIQHRERRISWSILEVSALNKTFNTTKCMLQT